MLCQAHVREFDNPLQAISAGLDESVVQSPEGKAALELLQKLQHVADESKRAADATPAAGRAPAAEPAGRQP
eukprot:2512285-Pyramimonas_sp.AAC.1